MSSERELASTTRYLFSVHWDDESFESSDRREKARALCKDYDWKDVFAAWFDYLKTECKTPEAVIKYVYLFYMYRGHEHFVKDPYPFIGYLYYRVDMHIYAKEAQNIFDSVVIDMLSHIGAASWMDDYYIPEKDPKILAAVKVYQEKAGRNQ